MSESDDILDRLIQRLDTFTQSLNPRSAVERFIDIAVKVLLVLAPAAGGVMYGHASRITALEQSTVTSREFQAQIASLTEKIATAANGPEWLRDGMASINAKMDVTRDLVSSFGERIARVESRIENISK